MTGHVSVFPIDARTDLPPLAGGKAHGLRHLVQAGLGVPSAWAVLPGAARGTVDALAAQLAARGVSRVAVRSSAADEDGGAHSFAGIHETTLGVRLDQLREVIAAVAASALSERARSYRTQLGLPPAAGPCAVVVQEMLDPDWAGVAFGRGAGVVVEAVEGLGETAVNGDATPETLELSGDGAAWRVDRRWPRRQAAARRCGPDGIVRVALRGAAPPLPEPIARELARGVAALERARGTPLDVEWAARDGRVAFLQARPQTRPLGEALAPGQTWSRVNASETLPEVASAYARAVGVPALDRLMHDFYRRVHVPLPPEVPLASAVAGRIVYNDRVFTAGTDLLGIPRSWGQILVGGAGVGTNAYAPPDPLKVLRNLGPVLRLAWFGARAERRARAMVREIRALGEARARLSLVSEDDEALLGHVTAAWGGRAHEALVVVLQVTAAFQQAVAAGATALASHPAPVALLARLLDPELVSVSTRQVEDLVELARAFRAWPGAATFLGEVGPELAAPGRWRETLPAPLWTTTEGWLARYGHRGPYESDVAQTSYADDLRLLAEALRPLVLAPEAPEPAQARRARRRADAAAAWREVASAHGHLVQLRVRGPARKLGQLMALREELRSTLTWAQRQTRRALLELGARLVARERLEAEEDVFHLSVAELERAVREPGFDAAAAVARERARVAAWRRLEVPTTFRSEEVAGFARRGPPAATEDAVLRGTAVSPGEVIGPACVLRSPQDGAKLRTGGILVAPSTDPGWTPVFARVAGVVVEVGGVMSHAATVAREYGLPCVSNVGGATRAVRDGDLLRVDGTRGVVEIVERTER